MYDPQFFYSYPYYFISCCAVALLLCIPAFVWWYQLFCRFCLYLATAFRSVSRHVHTSEDVRRSYVLGYEDGYQRAQRWHAESKTKATGGANE